MKKTKIVCTIGPACESESVLEKLIDSGMNVARLNFSHGTMEEHAEKIRTIRFLSEKKGTQIAILQDLAGPKIRIGNIKDGPVILQSDQSFILTTDNVPGDQKEVTINYAKLTDEVTENDRILLADGNIELYVSYVNRTKIHCKVIVGGELSSNKGLNLPGSTLSIPAITNKDRLDLDFGLDQGIDYVAMSFVRSKNDIQQIKTVMKNKNKYVPIIAKIEKHEALENIDEILSAVDGIMVARGDLAVETALENVPLVQKMLIKKCNQAGKPVITATQMLKSMVDSPRPTRAEANDVANAVLDGTDAVMLSEETAVGKYPIKAVQIMTKIIEATELNRDIKRQSILLNEMENESKACAIANAVSRASYEMAMDLKAKVILTPTTSGATAKMIARYRPNQPIIALSPNLHVIRQLNLVWGVYPNLVEKYKTTDKIIEYAKIAALKTGLVNKGDVVVITAGVTTGIPGTTNLIKADVLE